eukprot:TRINITY_DN6585_c0_g1_i1.p1 TRINITY_DN6585_c0_g1~~TRINITY_DN6585_c0_g1_i1.p1  ORF type:complete len:133 (-),score=15.28 TRINITY_DN6585_c0_g1_i1:621-1019(-)
MTKCNLCSNILSRGMSLEQHVSQSHPNAYVCTLCEKAWQNKNSYTKHLNTVGHIRHRQDQNENLQKKNLNSNTGIMNKDGLYDDNDGNTGFESTPLQDFWELNVQSLVKKFFDVEQTPFHNKTEDIDWSFIK